MSDIAVQMKEAANRGSLAILHRLRFGVPARIASVSARFVVRLTRLSSQIDLPPAAECLPD
jgi:hypothetical protein